MVVPLSYSQFLPSSMDCKTLIFLKLLLFFPQQHKQMSLKLNPYLTLGLVQPYLFIYVALSWFWGGRPDSFGSLWCIFKEDSHSDCQAGCQGIQAVPLKLCPYALCEPLGRQALLSRSHLYSPEWGKSTGAFGPMVLIHWSKWSIALSTTKNA